MNIHRYKYEHPNGHAMRVRSDEVYGWAAVKTETGEVDLESFQQFDDELRKLTDGWEWRRFTLTLSASVPAVAPAPCPVVDRVTAMAWDKLAIHEAIEATHPCRMETPESYAADALAMELVHKRHDKREIVNLIRWCLMGCPLN